MSGEVLSGGLSFILMHYDELFVPYSPRGSVPYIKGSLGGDECAK